MDIITLPCGTIFTVRYEIGMALPHHREGEREAFLLNGRLGIVVVREETPPWMHVYRCVIGRHDVSLGRGWLHVSEFSHMS